MTAVDAHLQTELREDKMRDAAAATDSFPTDTTGLPEASSTDRIELADGGQFDLRIAPVIKRIGDRLVRMLAYNGSVPGPTLHVQQGSEIAVQVANDGDMEATVHWHGLRLDNQYDGTTATQNPIPIGGTFTYRLTFPDPGVYWYHPHIREDYGQEMGLYGNIVVAPAEPDYWPPAHRDVTVTLDDIRLEDGRIAPFSRLHPNFTAMGRFGGLLLANGETGLVLPARQGEVVRFYLTNTANTRVFNVALPGARMKLVGGDSGRYERETFVDEVLIAPSERMVVDVLFDRAGELTLEHRTPKRMYPLAAITVREEAARPSLTAQFKNLRTNEDLVSERARMDARLNTAPDKTLAFVAEMNLSEPSAGPGGAVAYVCPMHPDVVDTEPGRCPQCGMTLMAAEMAAAYVCPMHPEVVSTKADRCSKCGMKLVPASLAGHAESDDSGHSHHHADSHENHHAMAAAEPAGHPAGIEWEDDMVEVNRKTNPTNTRWMLIDRATEAEGAAIDWRFRVGQQLKIRLVNEADSDHPMPHPLHIHGAGRFLILSRNGVTEPNLVWKDTVLVGTGETVDILLDVTHPGTWMAHCHIAEHHESGMMLGFRVDS